VKLRGVAVGVLETPAEPGSVSDRQAVEALA
jgi:hypothetical protein